MPCFLIGVTGEGYTASGEALLGSVSDNPYDVRTFVRSHHPKDRLAHVGTELVATQPPSFEERGYFCQEGETSRGVNTAGLAFTSALLFEDQTQPKHPSPVSFALLSKQLMEECHSVSEALDLLTKAKAVSPPFSLLLADRHGDLAHVEAGSFGVEVLHHFSKARPGAVFAVNCYQSKTCFNDPAASTDNSENNNGWRLGRGQQLCKQWQGKIDVNTMTQILSDHANRERDPLTNPLLEAWGFSICNHGTRKSEDARRQPLPWGTVSGEVLQPATKTLYYCYGWPCGEKPQFGDQFHQEDSWGAFYPFRIDKDVPEDHQQILTTTDGAILTEKTVVSLGESLTDQSV